MTVADAATIDFAKVKKEADREGYKLGVDLCGAAEMGGTEYFVSTIASADGNLEALTSASAEVFNEAKTVGTLLFSAGVTKLVAVARVPEDKCDAISAIEWVEAALKSYNGTVLPGATSQLALGEVAAPEGEFPIKMKDVALKSGLDFLRAKGKLQDDSGSEDEMIFGDDDIGNF